MVETIISIGHNLDMLVIAEGVETSKQLSILLGLKCEQIQGYLYSKPLNEQDMNNFLFTHQITDKSTSFINR
jgi:EAL domain-containing protein (putative c-di-GMP-specific phosphodiesterase class I)